MTNFEIIENYRAKTFILTGLTKIEMCQLFEVRASKYFHNYIVDYNNC